LSDQITLFSLLHVHKSRVVHQHCSPLQWL